MEGMNSGKRIYEKENSNEVKKKRHDRVEGWTGNIRNESRKEDRWKEGKSRNEDRKI
jgi:hypothetical protein